MIEFVLGLILFLGVHSVAIVAPGWRNAMVQRLGAHPWKLLYAVIAVVGIVLLISGYSDARWDSTLVYAPPEALRYLGMVLLLPVFPLLLAAYLPGRIRSTAAHPMLLAVKIWALAHLLMNGRVIDLVLFGAFLAWAVIDRIAIKRRPARPAASPTLPATPVNDGIAVVGGLAVYVAFVIALHHWLIGVPVLA